MPKTASPQTRPAFSSRRHCRVVIDGRTCRAARGFLNWTSRHLAAKSGVPVSKIFELERDRPIDEALVRRLAAVFLQNGVALVLEGGRATGVREVAAPVEPRHPKSSPATGDGTLTGGESAS